MSMFVGTSGCMHLFWEGFVCVCFLQIILVVGGSTNWIGVGGLDGCDRCPHPLAAETTWAQHAVSVVLCAIQAVWVCCSSGASGVGGLIACG